MDVNEAINLLKSLGYRVMPPKDATKAINGAYRVETHDGRVHFIEGSKGEESHITAIFRAKGLVIVTMEFQKDGFFFSEG